MIIHDSLKGIRACARRGYLNRLTVHRRAQMHDKSMLKVFTSHIAYLQSVTARERYIMTVGKGLARASDGTLKMPSADTDGTRARANSS